MHTKLTLRLDEQLIKQAKTYADRMGKSVSRLVADYLELLTTEKSKKKTGAAPVTRSLRGLLKKTGLDEQTYKEYLKNKYS